MSRSKILFISHSGTNNGAVRILIQLIEYFGKHSEYDIDILIQDPVENKIIEELSQIGNIFRFSIYAKLKKESMSLFIQIPLVMVIS